MVELFMPKTGMDQTEARLVRWLKAVGEEVKKDEPIMEVETDKLVMESESPASGILLAQLIEEGTMVPVLQTIGYIGEAGEKVPTASAPKETATDTTAAPATTVAVAVGSETAPSCAAGHVLASPYAKKMAKELNVDLASIFDGQFLHAKDVMAAGVAQKQVAATPLAKKYAEVEGVNLQDIDPVSGKIRKGDVLQAVQAKQDALVKKDRAPIHIPNTGIRKAIANNMYNSLQKMAQTTVSVDVDVTELMQLRKRLVDHKDLLGTKITVNDLLSYATVKMVKAHPLANATYTDTETITYPYVNLSFGVAADYGLTSPVIHDADLMSLAELSVALRETTIRARERKLTAEDQREPTITLTNVGIYPIDVSTPILPYPQSCIMGFGRCVEKPAVYQGQLCIRTMMSVSMTYDHRVFDGSGAGAIMKTMKEYLEMPELFLAQ